MGTPYRGLQPVCDNVLLEVYLNELGYLSAIDGKLDAVTRSAVKRFQAEHELVIDGVAGEKTWTKLFASHPELTAAIAAKWLSREDLERTSAALGLSLATVRAVYRVESCGSGFWGRRPKILFEGHVFWKRLKLKGKLPSDSLPQYENVLYPRWDRTKYLGGPAEYGRLASAQTVDSSAALESASWGLFQIMGYHADLLDYASVEEFVSEMAKNEGAQLEAFGRFVGRTRCEGKTLLHWLRERDWAKFAKGYNGPAFAANNYDVRLRSEYEAARIEGLR